jgi:hypothetical protein
MKKWWVVLGFVLLVFLAVVLSSESEENKGTTLTTTPTITPQNTFEQSTTSQRLTLTPTATTINSNDDKLWTSLMKSALSEKINVTSIQVANGRDKGGVKAVIVAYTSNAKNKNDFVREIAYITGVFLGAKQQGWDIDELMGIVGNQEGKAVGIWYCKREWANQYLNGELTMEEVGLKVLGTFKVLSS